MNILLSLTIITFATANGALLGSEKCTWGPSYWCSHIGRAKECGAFKHCLDSVWTKQIINPEQTPQCTLCQMLVNETRQMLQNKATKEYVIDFLKRGCEFLPAAELKQQCDLVVKDYIPELFNLLNSSLSSEVICATIQLCSGFEDKVHIYEDHETAVKTKTVAIKDNKTCTDCTNFITDLKNMVKESATQIEMMLKQVVCSQLGEFQSECDTLVDQYVPMFLQQLVQEVVPQQVCTALGFCNSGDIHKASMIRLKLRDVIKQYNRKSIGDAEECNVCKTVMKDVQDFIRDPTEQANIKAFIKNNLCTLLGPFEAECQSIIEQYASEIFELLVNEMDPDSDCILLGFCGTAGLKHRPKVVPAKSIMPAIKIDSKVGDGVLCFGCKYVVEQIDAFLKENKTEEEIEEELLALCNKLPSNLKDSCTSIVNQYLPAILVLFEEMDPTVICQNLHLCNTTTKITTQLKAGNYCSVCENIVKEVENILENPDVQAQIEAALDKICELLPGNSSSECKNAVDTYLPTVILLLKTELTPAELCGLFSICPSKVAFSAVQKKKSDSKCSICVEIVTFAKGFVQKYTKDEINALLYKVCALVKSFEDQCKGFVDKYIDTAINVVKNSKPEVVCELGKFCPAAVALKQTMKMQSSEECVVCKLVAKELENLIQDKAVEADIKVALDKVCNIIPSQYKDECTTLVGTYSEVIIKIILAEVDPNTVCTVLTLCPTSRKALDINKEKVKDATCQMCEDIDNELIVIFKKYDVSDIAAFLDTICDDIKQFLDPGTCKQYVNTFETLVIGQVESSTPKEICEAITLCAARKYEVKPLKESPGCAICEFAMKELEALITKNATEADIEAALEKLCGLLPSTLTDECDSFVEKYSKEIIDLLLQQVSPAEICKTLKLCNSTSTMSSTHDIVKAQKQTQNNRYTMVNGVPILQLPDVAIDPVRITDEKCLACQIVANYIIQALNENSTQEEIEKVLEKTCTKLPGDIGTECSALVEEYLEQIIQMVQQKLNPEKICQDLKFCTASNVFKNAREIAKHLMMMKPGKGGKKVKDTTLFFRSKQDRMNSLANIKEMAQVKPKKTPILDVKNILKDRIPELERKVHELRKRKWNRQQEMKASKFFQKAEKNILLKSLR